jgi:hypothetical protein
VSALALTLGEPREDAWALEEAADPPLLPRPTLVLALPSNARFLSHAWRPPKGPWAAMAAMDGWAPAEANGGRAAGASPRSCAESRQSARDRVALTDAPEAVGPSGGCEMCGCNAVKTRSKGAHGRVHVARPDSGHSLVTRQLSS